METYDAIKKKRVFNKSILQKKRAAVDTFPMQGGISAQDLLRVIDQYRAVRVI